ncbi:hypothetical protein F9U64_04930 [Gracilibacillus oryzae]|uniref:Uncharacterized protein n=1 Tax=Gracilibacillus oryzae TaxID=1672701 RepID=A0A7C8GW30_9BACI|nr:hypothetical protein [Gracilibacillus oryzae]KAB8138497.1 hypothetical protein F9U64_04930 [Gracilibacillus oryzae]
MEEFIYIYILWLLWCLTTFFFNKTKLRTVYSLGILLLIICVPYTTVIGEITLNSGVILLVFYSFGLLMMLSMPMKKYLYTLLFAYLYVIYFVWYITNPILSYPYFMLIGIIVATIVLQIFERDFHQRILIWITSLAFGQVLYTLICWSYSLEFTINYHDYYILFCSVLLLLCLINIWLLLLKRMELVIQGIESKKRWTY